MILKRSWAFLLALIPFISFAQSAPSLYVGGSAALLWTNPFGSYVDARVGPALTLGLQLSRRWALETGAQLYWKHYTYSDELAAGGGTYHAHFTYFAVPLVARYALTAPAGRWQVDALGGGFWLHSNGLFTLDYGVPTSSPYESPYSSNEVALLLGPQVRYRLASRLDLKLSFPVNLTLARQGEFSRLYLTPQLGAQYTFGRKS